MLYIIFLHPCIVLNVSFIAKLAYASRVDNKIDVYSFGVVALEVIFRKHPGELISSLLSLESRPSSLPSIIDHLLLVEEIERRLSPSSDQVAEKVVVVVKVALECLNANPQSRPTMGQVCQALSRHRPPLSKPLSMITLGELLLDHGNEIA